MANGVHRLPRCSPQLFPSKVVPRFGDTLLKHGRWWHMMLLSFILLAIKTFCNLTFGGWQSMKAWNLGLPEVNPSWHTLLSLVVLGTIHKLLLRNQFLTNGRMRFLPLLCLDGTWFDKSTRCKRRQLSFGRFFIRRWWWMNGEGGSQSKLVRVAFITAHTKWSWWSIDS